MAEFYIGSKRERLCQAKALLLRALAIREKIQSPDDLAIAETIYKLGQIAADLNELKDCVPYLERWIARHDKMHLPEREQFGNALFWLASAVTERKDFEAAERLLAKAQTVFEKTLGTGPDVFLDILSMRFDAAFESGRFDDAERFINRSMELEYDKIGPQDPVVVEMRSLMATSYKDHTRDRRAPVLWLQLDAFRRRNDRVETHDTSLAEIVARYAKLLRRTNTVLAQPTEEDLTYLMKRDVVHPWEYSIDGLEMSNVLWSVPPVDEALSHIARLYDLQQFYADCPPAGTSLITDQGLSRIRNLINMRRLSLEGADITDQGLSYLVDFNDLEYLRLSDAPIDDKAFTHLEGFTRLRELRLDGTNVSDAGLDQLTAMNSLLFLDLRRTRVSRAGFDRLKRARPDVSIKYDTRKPGVSDKSARE